MISLMGGMYVASLVMMPFATYHNDMLAVHVNLFSGMACAIFLSFRVKEKEKKVE